MWEIKGKDNQVKATVGSLEYNGEWMGESYVTVTVESPAPVNFEIGDYIIYRDERFEINYNPGKIKSAPRYEKGDAFKYENIKFNSLADELTRCDFLDIVLNDNQLHFTGLPKFSFYGGVKDLANRMQANLDRTYGKGTWSVVVSPEFQSAKEVNISVDTIKVQGALSILVNDLETYYTIKGRTITIGAAGIPAGHLFKYGRGNGLYEIEQNAEADQAIVTRLRAYGSTRNLPHRYYNSLSGADGKKLIPDNMAVQYLMLPKFPYTTQDPYIDSPNIAKLGIRDGSVFFDGSKEKEGLPEIYPSIEGMTAEQLKAAGVPCNSTGALDEIVSAEQMTDNGVSEINEGETQTPAKPPTFKVILKDLGFDINDHKTTEAATISFKTGMLGGRDFEIVKNGCKPIKDASGKVTGYELELNRVYDDSIKLWFPYSAYNAQAGDKFVLLHIEMPEVYIKAAAQRLKEAATEWLSKNDHSRSIYAPKVDEIFMARQHDLAMASDGKIKSLHDTLKEGMLLLFEDEDLNIDASIFIDRLTIKEEGAVPTYEVVLKEEKTVGTLQKMQNKIDSLAAGMGQGGGGYNASQIRSMIEAYGGTRFLSKLKDDRSQGQIASDMAIEVGDFLAGVSGAKIGKDAETGQTFGEMDRLFIRIKAYFETLTIINADSLAGVQRITPGGGVKCTSVEELDDVYRCYFLSEQDGEKTETKLIAGDQAIAQIFNAKTGTSNKVSNHRYWRLVTSVSNDAYTDYSGNRYGYIDLSKSDCERGSDIPQVGDTIVQFGNRNDRTRRAAMVFSTVDADAPSVKLLTELGSGDTNEEHYSLVDKDIVSYGYDSVKGNAYFNCYGDSYIGSRDGSTFIKYNCDTEQLDIKARLLVESTIGNLPIDDYISGKIPLTEVGGANLLVNSDFADGFNGWAHTDGLVEIRPGANDGEPKTVQIISEGATSLTWAGITQGPTEYLLASPGENMIASLYAHGDPSSFDKDAWLEVWFYDSNKEPLSTLSSLGEKITPTDSLRRRVVYKFKTPEGTAYVGVKIYIKQNGRLFIDSLKVERGTVATDWSLSPVDEKTRLHSFDYLKAALKEDTIVGGGLVQTSMLLLGHTDPNSGLYKIMAGSSGLWDPDKGGRTIASWWGGSAVDLFDADGNLLAEPPADAAQAMVRMDGSGYLAGGAIHWGTDGKLHADPLSFFVGEEYVGLHLSLFQFFPGTVDAIGLVDYAIPQAPFSKLMIGTRSSHGLIEWDGENSCFCFNGSVCATGNIVGFNGDGPDGGGSGGGSSYGLMRQWPSTAPGADTTDALGANLGYELLTRLSAVETDYITGDTVELLLQELTDGIGAKFVQALEVRGDKLVWTKNDVDNALTIPYATSAGTAATLSSTRKIWGQSFKGDGNVSGRWELDGNTAGAFSIFRDATVAAINLQSYANMPLVINRAGNNVGIGNITSPAAKLHVGGSFRAGASVLDSLTVTGDGNFLHLASSTQRCQFSTGVDERVLLQVDGASLAGGVATWRCAIMRADIDGHIAFGAVYPLPDYRVYIPDNLRVDKGITVKSGEYIYLNESHTAWLRYNAASGCIETNVSFMSHQNIIGTKE